MKILKQIFLLLINIYQKIISPFFRPKCRFYPSCSNYAKDAYLKFNLIRATKLTLWRIIKCNPLFNGGFDPIPWKKEQL